VQAWEQTWRQNTKNLRPLLTRLRVAARGCSQRLQRALTDFGADEAFAKAAAKMREHYGLDVNSEQVRRVCLHHAGRISAKAVLEPRTTLATRGPDWIVAEADGTMLPIVDTDDAPSGSDRRKHRVVSWQETRVVAAQVLGEVTTHYDATLGEVAEAGARWSQVVGAAGWAVNTRVHAIGDGAPWLAAQARERFGAQGSYLLDLYHVCDYLAAVWPGDKAEVHRHRDALKAGELDSVLDALRARLEPPERSESEAPARAALRYLQNRLDQLDYPAAIANGLPVGSGLIESAHRHLLQSRLKIAGAWWNRSHAHDMTQLRVTRANGLWDNYWQN
jgi:Uncharacterised protein family (UPF0236)